MKKLKRDFYNRDTLIVAKELVGKYLVYESNEQKLIGMITETEAYKGVEDKAAHSYGGRMTERTKIMFGEAGYAYIYLIYGMYYCLNVVTEEVGNPCAVLIRGIEPVEGLEQISKNRYNKQYNELSKYQKNNIGNGPGKLCKAFELTKNQNSLDMCGHKLYICEKENEPKYEILEGKRINIDYAQEYKDKLWRFYLK